MASTVSQSLFVAVLVLGAVFLVARSTRSSKGLQAAAEGGDPQSQRLLGEAYLQGADGVSKDDAMAAFWFTKAAEQGNNDAQYNLGICFQKGIGVARDQTAAYRWFRAACTGSGLEAGSDHLAREVWAGFGPYSTASSAEFYLRRAVRSVSEMTEQPDLGAGWVDDWAEQLRSSETSGVFGEYERNLRAQYPLSVPASAEFAAAFILTELNLESEGNKLIAGVNEILAPPGSQFGSKLAFTDLPDGRRVVTYEKLGTEDERAAEKTQQAQQLGDLLATDDFPEAEEFKTFLVRQFCNAQGEPLPLDLGRAVFAGIKLQVDEPASAKAAEFLRLYSAWEKAGGELDE
jgi:hypothetical protein